MPFLPVLLLFLLTRAASARADEADRTQLLNGVDALTVTGEAPAPVTAFAPAAFPVVAGVRADGTWLPAVVASRWQRGRVVAFGASGFLSTAALERAGNATLLTNAARWASGGRGDAVVVVVDNPAAAAVLEKAGVRVARCTPTALSERMEAPDFEAVVMEISPLDGKEGRRLAEFLSAFLRRGGGAILTGNGRTWAAAHPEMTLVRHHNGNFLTAPMGLAWTRGTLASPEGGAWSAPAQALADADSRVALQALWKHADGSARLADAALGQATRAASAPVPALPGLEGWFSSRAQSLCRKYPPTLPTSALHPTARLQFSLDLRAADLKGAGKVAAHPSAATFPGAVASGARVTRTVHIAGPGWRSTGLYAAPGETVTVALPPSEVGRGLSAMIGVHAAALWRQTTWERFPQVTVRQPLTAATTRISSAFGGPIRLFVPGGATAEATVAGAVDTGGPWTILEGKVVTLTVPSVAARALVDPKEALQFWDNLAASTSAFVGVPRSVQLVVDRQSDGEVFLDNHIAVAPESAANRLLDVALLKGADPVAAWDLHLALATVCARGQRVFVDADAAVALLLAQWLSERDNGAAEAVLPDLAQAKRLERRRQGASFRDDPRLAFDMLYTIRLAVGWEPLQRGFAAAATAADPVGAFAIQASRAADRNLVPYLESWGVKVPEAARAVTARLPRWSPER